ncbi:MAG: aminodeoxychorismate/anthranilate synthase component II [Sphingomonas sp.]|uniref:anthranilate synthase component II n=1 Tax=Sphingomonas sp. TaxID=28214 RepID=UPI00179CA6FD|nr:aminodeoxychorismate/anthranilate synthase component II [Sphingomonas sp.]MBA3667814.1 aminodeoxychorismate/anthranilate synthase component II [Sphingomonas sp.]
MRVLLIDNRDSFTFNLGEACRAAGAEVEVVRNSIAAEDALDRALRFGALLMLSPGPGRPDEAGCCMELIEMAAGVVPLIGICLGHQAIVEAAGGDVVRAHEPCHGQSSAIDHDGDGPFAGLPSPLRVGRYHSLCTPLNEVPDRLRVHAVLDGMAMAVRDEAKGQFGLQFHPESILTPMGDRLLGAILSWADARRIAFGGLTRAVEPGKVAA